MKVNYYRKGEGLPLDNGDLGERIRMVFGTVLLNSTPCWITIIMLPAVEHNLFMQLLISAVILLFASTLTYFSNGKTKKSQFDLLVFYPTWLIITLVSIVIALLIANKVTASYHVLFLVTFWLIPYLYGIYSEFKNITIKLEK